ncbi:MAG: hypothetical protein ACTHJ5_11550 [Ilyomonas sp.]
MAGLGITIWLIAQTATITGLILLLYLFAFALYSYSIYCGTLLLKKKKDGLVHSSVNQYLQLVNFAVLGFGFKYVSGLLLSVGIDLTSSLNIKFNLGLMSSWEMNINSDTERIEVNLNLIALFVILFIDKLKKSREQYENEVQLQNVAE